MKYFLSIALAVVLSVPASAALQVGSKVMLDTTLPGTRGGQFGVDDPGNPAGFGFNSFVTFCAELEDTIANNGMYFVTSIATQNSAGATLSAQAAYLYDSFVNGTLGTFDYNSAADANALQYGIWLGMGYTEAQAGDGTREDDWDDKSGGWLANFAAWGAGIGNVRIMQLGDVDGGPGNRQDQLVMIPEPASLAIWGLTSLGLMGLCVIRRRRRAA